MFYRCPCDIFVLHNFLSLHQVARGHRFFSVRECPSSQQKEVGVHQVSIRIYIRNCHKFVIPQKSDGCMVYFYIPTTFTRPKIKQIT